MAKKELTPEDLVAAGNLRKIWGGHRKDKKSNGKKCSQESVANDLKITQGAFGQYLNGITPIGTVATLKFADYFNVSPYDIRPDFSFDSASSIKNKSKAHDEHKQALQFKELTQALSRLPIADAKKLAKSFEAIVAIYEEKKVSSSELDDAVHEEINKLKKKFVINGRTNIKNNKGVKSNGSHRRRI